MLELDIGIALETGFLLGLQLRHHHCRQTPARVPLFVIHFTSALWKQFAANDMFLSEASAHVKKLLCCVLFYSTVTFSIR